MCFEVGNQLPNFFNMDLLFMRYFLSQAEEATSVFTDLGLRIKDEKVQSSPYNQMVQATCCCHSGESSAFNAFNVNSRPRSTQLEPA